MVSADNDLISLDKIHQYFAYLIRLIGWIGMCHWVFAGQLQLRIPVSCIVAHTAGLDYATGTVKTSIACRVALVQHAMG